MQRTTALGSLANESLAGHQLLLFLDFGPGTVDDLQPQFNTRTHPVVQIGLGTLDVIVQIVAEDLNQVNRTVDVVGNQVLVEQHKRDEANIVARLDTVNALQIEWRVTLRESHRWHTAQSLADIAELRQEDFGKLLIVRVTETNRIDDHRAIAFGFDVKRLVVAILDASDPGDRRFVGNRLENAHERLRQNVPLQEAVTFGGFLNIASGHGIALDGKSQIVTVFGIVLHLVAVDLIHLLAATVGQQLANALPTKRNVDNGCIVDWTDNVELDSIKIGSSHIETFAPISWPSQMLLERFKDDSVVEFEKDHC